MDEARTLFAGLFEPTDLVELRFLPPGEGSATMWLDSPEELALVWDEAERRNQGGRDVYFGVNPRAMRARGDDAVKVCRSLFADFDGIGIEKAGERCHAARLPTPTAIVTSGHGVHCYWRLTETLEPAAWTAAQKRIAEAVGSDPKVCNPERIARLPGTLNQKRRDGARCALVDAGGGVVAWSELDAMLPVVETRARPERTEAMPAGARGELPRSVLRWLSFGADEGERNAQAFSAACAMLGAGWPEAEVWDRVTGRAMADGLSASEADQVMRSASGKPRTPPSTAVDDGPVGSAFQHAEVGQVAQASVTTRKDAQAEPPAADDDPDGLLVVGDPQAPKGPPKPFSNVVEIEVETEKGTKTVFAPTEVGQIHQHLALLTGGWPRTAGGMLFVPGDQAAPGSLPGSRSVIRLADTNQMKAWLHTATRLYWHESAGVSRSGEDVGQRRSAIKSSEFFEYLTMHAHPRYLSTETLPHHPPVPRTYYAPCVLKRSPASVVYEFAERFNADTAVDRTLMIAALLTLFWGGPAGGRPAMLLKSRFGAGAGKTTSAEMIAYVAGGAISTSPKEDTERFVGRLLSDTALARRAVLIDNIRRKFDNPEIESMITAREIHGHRMYHGQASRPNLITWFLTSNIPQLSHDLAERSVIINIGTQRANASFVAETYEWIDRHRPSLVASILGILAGEDRSPVQSQHLDRWAKWQTGVLAKVEGGDAAAKLARDRRAEVNADAEDAEDIAEKIASKLRVGYSLDPDRCRVFIQGKVLHHWLVQMELDEGGKALNHRGVASFLRSRIGTGPLKVLQPVRSETGKGYAWTGEFYNGLGNYDEKITDDGSEYHEPNGQGYSPDPPF